MLRFDTHAEGSSFLGWGTGGRREQAGRQEWWFVVGGSRVGRVAALRAKL